MFYQVFFLYYKGTKKFPHVQTFSEKNRKKTFTPSHPLQPTEYQYKTA